MLLELGLQLLNERGEVHRASMHRHRFHERAQLTVRIGRKEMRKRQLSWLPFLRHCKRAEEVKPQERQGGQVFLAERLVVKLGTDQSEPAQRTAANSELSQDCPGGFGPSSHYHVLDGSPSGNEETDGTIDVSGELRKNFGDLGRNY